MKYLSFLLICSFLLHNCSNTPAKETPADTSADQSAQVPAVANTTSIICVSGLLQCRDSVAVLIETVADTAARQFNLIDKTKTLLSLHNKATEPVHHVVEMSRAVVCGEVVFANKEARLLTMEVHRVESVVAKTIENFGLSFEFWCEGSDPADWRVEISNYIGFIYYENAGDATGRFCPWYPAKVSGNKWTYDIPDNTGQYGTLSLVIKKEKYTNAKTQKAYDYSCELKVDGKTLKGGAVRGTANVLGPIVPGQN
ncbi:MAG: hypothetical protein ACKVT2_16970 [Saprospiraceae bacterium]